MEKFDEENKEGKKELNTILDPNILKSLWQVETKDLGPLTEKITKLEELVPGIKLDNIISLYIIFL